MNPVILYEPDGYQTNGPQFLGRQSAGAGFLRAHVEGRAEGVLGGFTPFQSSALSFRDTVKAIDPTAQVLWVNQHKHQLIAENGVFYRPDHNLLVSGNFRLRLGADRYALSGVTHTLASTGGLELMASLMQAPLFEWDALVCTSTVAVQLFEEGYAENAEYLKWRFGQDVTAPKIQLRHIPLAVHCVDFDFTAEDRAAAREALGLADDEVVGLFAGRLSFSGKANPYQMYRGMQAAAEITGKKLVMMHAGQFPSPQVAQAFKDGAKTFCPSVRTLFVDGKDPVRFHQTWAASDLFLSLSDSIQETFGITPVEAMASGLPVVVSDWNGYKDTVRHGQEGFRVTSWQPAPDFGDNLTRDYELNATNYEYFLSRSSTTVSVEMRELAQALVSLVNDPQLRARMGASGKARARALYDWPVVYKQYQALWAEQREMIKTAKAPPGAPPAAMAWRDPYSVFHHFPTHHITPQTRVTLRPRVDIALYKALTEQPLVGFWNLDESSASRVIAALQAGPLSVADLAETAGIGLADMLQNVGRFAKMGLVQLGKPAAR